MQSIRSRKVLKTSSERNYKEWHLYHVELWKEEEESQDRYLTWSFLEIKGTHVDEKRRESRAFMMEVRII